MPCSETASRGNSLDSEDSRSRLKHGFESRWSHHRTTVPESLEGLHGLALQQPPVRETPRQPIPPSIAVHNRFHVDLVDQKSPEGLAGLSGVSAQESHHVLNPLSQVSLEPRRVERRHGRESPKMLEFLGERLLSSLLLAEAALELVQHAGAVEKGVQTPLDALLDGLQLALHLVPTCLIGLPIGLEPHDGEVDGPLDDARIQRIPNRPEHQ